MLKTCQQCDAEFPTARKQAKYCSAPCRKRASRGKAPALTVVPTEPDPETAGTLEASVRKGIDCMTWLTSSDQPMASLALTVARTVDSEGSADAVARLSPILIKALKELGGTPADRKAIGVEQEVKGKLASLRHARGKTG